MDTKVSRLMKFGIVGAGVIGRRFANVFSATGDEILWICDLNLAKAEKLAEEFGGKATDDLAELLNDEEVQTVYVGVVPKFHKEITIRALEKLKNVICEKPIALSSEDGEEMIAAAHKSGKLTAINLPFRFTTGIKKMQELLASNFVGKIRRIELRFRFPDWPRKWQQVDWLRSREQGGPLREVGTHFFFLLNELEEFIGRPTRVLSLNEYSGKDGCESSSVGMIEFDSGLICSIDLLTGSSEDEENTIRILGEKEGLAFKQWYLLEDLKGNVLCDIRESSERKMVEAFKESSDTLVTFDDALRAQRILESIHNSNGEWVELE